MSEPLSPKIVDPTTDAWSSAPDGTVRPLASAADTEGAYSARLERLRPGGTLGLGRDDAREAVFIVSGAVEFRVGDRIGGLPAGGLLAIAGGGLLRLENQGDAPAELFVLTVPTDAGGSRPATEQGVLVREPGEGAIWGVVGDRYTIMVGGDETGGRFALIDALIPPGGGPPPHLHTREHEGFYILEGEVIFFAEGGSFVARPGAFLNIPPGVVHNFRNETDALARQLFWVAPSGLDRMFAEIGVAIPDQAAPTPPASPEQIQALIAVVGRYGIELRLPPS